METVVYKQGGDACFTALVFFSYSVQRVSILFDLKRNV